MNNQIIEIKKIYLDKLFEFTYSTYKNYYGQFNKVINLNDEITKIKQNLSQKNKLCLYIMFYIICARTNLTRKIQKQKAPDIIAEGFAFLPNKS